MMKTRSSKQTRLEAPSTGQSGAEPAFHRSLGLQQAVSINMTQMCGIGPFITIPIMVATMGGPQAVFGWIVGAILAMADGLVWAELGAAMPGSGGSYIYLREAFKYRTGKVMPFLFIWTMMLTIPLIMATGVIGLVDYLEFFLPHLSWLSFHLICLVVTGLVVFLLYRRIESIGIITTILWVVMLICVIAVISAGFSDFTPSFAFTYPQGAFGSHFVVGLGAGLIIGMYDYLGYYTTAYMGDELRDPGRTMPRAIIISIIAIMLIYLALNIAVMGVLPWEEVAHSDSIASVVVMRTWGYAAAAVVTVLVIITAFASIFAGLLGGSRVPFQAARDGLFFSAIGKLHPKYDFPHVALIAMGIITAIGTFFDLTDVIGVLIAASVVVQFIAQIVALVTLRRRQPLMHRPYRQWLYPLPCIVAALGWIYIYISGTVTSIVFSTVWIIGGGITFLVWARINDVWPFAALEAVTDYKGEVISED